MSAAAIGLTMGDPGGIGPEVIVKTLARLPKNSPFQYVVYGSKKVFEYLEILRPDFSRPQDDVLRQIASLPKVARHDKQWLRFVDITLDAEKILSARNSKKPFEPGKISLVNAALAFAALSRAAQDAQSGRIQAIVTAPVNKLAMRLLDPDFHGHTEYLAKTAGAKKFAMMFVSPRLKVTLVTIHVALKKVSSLIKKSAVLEKIELTDQFLKQCFKIKKPKIAVCALNPHGRETGTEEDQEIVPAVKVAARKGIAARGPLSSDQLFYDAYEGRFDAVISMYHDQGLAPFKMIAFKDGVNVTLGLPYIRTSPDHGTAFDIAYQGKADPASFEAALKLAQKLLR